MATSTTLRLTTRNGNKKNTKNITYANPAATDENLATFMAALLNLSQNQLVNVERLDSHELTIPQPQQP